MNREEIIKGLKIATRKIGGCSDVGGWLDNDEALARKSCEEAIKLLEQEPFDLEGLKSDMKALNCGYPYGLDYLLDCLNKRLGVTIVERKKASKE